MRAHPAGLDVEPRTSKLEIGLGLAKNRIVRAAVLAPCFLLPALGLNLGVNVATLLSSASALNVERLVTSVRTWSNRSMLLRWSVTGAGSKLDPRRPEHFAEAHHGDVVELRALPAGADRRKDDDGLRDVPRFTPSGEEVTGPIVLQL